MDQPLLSRQVHSRSSQPAGSAPLTCIICGSSHQWQWMLAKHYDAEHLSIGADNPYKKLPVATTAVRSAGVSSCGDGARGISSASHARPTGRVKSEVYINAYFLPEITYIYIGVAEDI